MSNTETVFEFLRVIAFAVVAFSFAYVFFAFTRKAHILVRCLVALVGLWFAWTAVIVLIFEMKATFDQVLVVFAVAAALAGLVILQHIKKRDERKAMDLAIRRECCGHQEGITTDEDS